MQVIYHLFPPTPKEPLRFRISRPQDNGKVEMVAFTYAVEIDGSYQLWRECGEIFDSQLGANNFGNAMDEPEASRRLEREIRDIANTLMTRDAGEGNVPRLILHPKQDT